MSSQDNPSHLVTRGITKHALLSSSLWWEGPAWLPYQDSWPNSVERDEDVTVDFTTLNVESTLSLPVPVPHLAMLNWDWYGSYGKSWHVIAWLLRFVKILRDKTLKKHTTMPKYTTITELISTEAVMSKSAQGEEYSEEHHYLTSGQDAPSNLVKQLGLYMDEGVIRCRDKIHRSAQSDETIPSVRFLFQINIV